MLVQMADGITRGQAHRALQAFFQQAAEELSLVPGRLEDGDGCWWVRDNRTGQCQWAVVWDEPGIIVQPVRG